MAEIPMDHFMEFYTNELAVNKEIPAAISAAKALLYLIKTIKSETMIEVQNKMQELIERLVMKNVIMSVVSGCELFVRFITLTSMDQPNFAECKQLLIQRGMPYI
ncbi:hypothetical protein MXB_5502 [Myxobolus squamalis]|nr:hypothetical protein MXB_5502 [Myxobolus squamalis]